MSRPGNIGRQLQQRQGGIANIKNKRQMQRLSGYPNGKPPANKKRSWWRRLVGA